MVNINHLVGMWRELRLLQVITIRIYDDRILIDNNIATGSKKRKEPSSKGEDGQKSGK